MVLECVDVSIGYEDQTVVNGLNFRMDEGDYVCVVGENGAGKSSLLKGILGLAKVKAGKIEFGLPKGRKDIGYLSQQKDFQNNFPATVQEVVWSGFVGNMGFRPFYTIEEKKKAKRLIEEFGMTEYSKKPFSVLSGGQKQRILLARALCASDKFLLLDEPVTGLDPVACQELYDLLKKINKEKKTTILMVTHDLNKAIEDSNKILHIGRVNGYFGASDEYLESEAAKSFLGLNGKENE